MLIIGGTIVSAVVIYRRGLWRMPVLRRVPETFRPEVQIVFAAALFTCMLFAGGIARAVTTTPAIATTVADLARPSAVIYAITAAAAGVIVLLRTRRIAAVQRELREIKVPRRGGSIHSAAAAIAGLALIWPLMSIAGWIVRTAAVLLGADQPEPIAHTTLELFTTSEIDAAFLLLAACVVLGAPFVEEVLYRMLLQDAFVRAFGHPWPGIIIVSAFFTLMHMPVVHWTALLPLMLFSISLGVVYERTGRLRSVVFMHAAFNLFNLALARMISGAGGLEETGGPEAAESANGLLNTLGAQLAIVGCAGF